MDNVFDTIVVGGGQSGLAVGYYLRRSGLTYCILDQEEEPGGSWQHYWNSLRLFSPAQWSSLPGMIMPGGSNYYPTRHEALQYIQQYESKNGLAVKRPVNVIRVTKDEAGFKLKTSAGDYICKTLVSATGSFRNPVIPAVEGIHDYKGTIIHAAQYKDAVPFTNKRVAIVGEGNSGAQILAEVSTVAETLWITLKEPRFLPDEIDGRYLFDAATQLYEAKKQGRSFTPPSLGDIVMVPSVMDARSRNVLNRLPAFQRFTSDSLIWDNGHTENVDAVIFCTGYKPALHYLQNLNIVTTDTRVDTLETKATAMKGLWLVGYGNWTGFASATLIGVGRSAKRTVEEITLYLSAK